MPIVEYRCEDGSPFPVSFVEGADTAFEWRLEQEHSSGPHSPMQDALYRLGRPGRDRAYAEAGLPSPSMWRQSPSANGYPYFVQSLPEGDEMAALFAGCGALVVEHGSALGIWLDFSLPRVSAVCDWLRTAPADTPLALLAEEHTYAQHHTMVSSMVTWNDMNAVTAMCAPYYGESAELVAYELSQGYENETLTADRELYRVAQLLSAELSSADPEAAVAARRAADPEAQGLAALDSFLSTYGWRAEEWSIDQPMWRELGAGFWAQLRQLARVDAPSPDATLARAAARRQALFEAIDAQLAGEPDQQARFRRRVERLAGYVPVREGRAMWQLITTGSLRYAVLSRGELLADQGIIDAPNDVLFALPDEVDAPPADLRDRVRERRAEHDHWRAVSPPLVVGAAANSSAPPPGPNLKGIAASRGVATGTARVVLDLADADRVEPGDVLVCSMTAPPWTPLFAIAAAVVTESGELGSHPAIAAREYGIPCVVGAVGVTKAIRDGDAVVVDGTAGTVTVQAS